MQKVEGSSPFIRFAKMSGNPGIFFCAGKQFGGKKGFVYQLPLPNSASRRASRGWLAQSVEVADQIGLDEAEVAADLDAGDEAAAGVVAEGRLLEREEGSALR